MNHSELPELAQPLRHFKSYPAYKDSGVEWLGQIPAHWKVKPIRSLARPGYKSFTDGDWIESPYIRDEGIRLIQTGNIGVGEYREQGFRYIDEETFRAFGCTEVQPGDVLICRLAEPVGRACLAPDLGCRMITSVDVCILKPGTDVDAAHVVYALSGSEYLGWLGGICRGGTRDRVSRSMLGAIQIQQPPLDEQRAIVTFLDREIERIDELVAKKEKLINLLEEQRGALIARVVAKGLDSNAPMKDSGVEWLGRIPAHWNTAKMWQISSATSGGTPSRDNNAYWNGNIPWVTPKDMKRRFIDSSEETITEQAVRESRLKLIAESVVLIVVRGMILVHTLPVAIPRVPVTINQDMKALHFRRDVEPTFMAWVLEGAGDRLLASLVDEAAHGTRAIRMDRWRSVEVPIPAAREQRAITSYLDRETQRIDDLIAKVGDAIRRLKEFRMALISAAVTGKIDVREEIG